MKSRRSKLLVDRPVQLQVTSRLLFHWFAFLMVVVVALPLLRTLLKFDVNTPLAMQAADAGLDAVIIGVLFLMLLPYFVYDTFRTTNRFSGPMYRLHQTLKAMSEGIPCPPMKFRKNDFWTEVAVDFNKAIDKVRAEKGSTAKATEAKTQKEEITAV
jgi:hypothetical protein